MQQTSKTSRYPSPTKITLRTNRLVSPILNVLPSREIRKVLPLFVKVQYRIRAIIAINEADLQIHSVFLDKPLDLVGQALHVASSSVDADLCLVLREPRNGRVNLFKEIWFVGCPDDGHGLFGELVALVGAAEGHVAFGHPVAGYHVDVGLILETLVTTPALRGVVAVPSPYHE